MRHHHPRARPERDDDPLHDAPPARVGWLDIAVAAVAGGLAPSSWSATSPTTEITRAVVRCRCSSLVPCRCCGGASRRCLAAGALAALAACTSPSSARHPLRDRVPARFLLVFAVGARLDAREALGSGSASPSRVVGCARRRPVGADALTFFAPLTVAVWGVGPDRALARPLVAELQERTDELRRRATSAPAWRSRPTAPGCRPSSTACCSAASAELAELADGGARRRRRRRRRRDARRASSARAAARWRRCARWSACCATTARTPDRAAADADAPRGAARARQGRRRPADGGGQPARAARRRRAVGLPGRGAPAGRARGRRRASTWACASPTTRSSWASPGRCAAAARRAAIERARERVQLHRGTLRGDAGRRPRRGRRAPARCLAAVWAWGSGGAWTRWPAAPWAPPPRSSVAGRPPPRSRPPSRWAARLGRWRRRHLAPRVGADVRGRGAVDVCRAATPSRSSC